MKIIKSTFIKYMFLAIGLVATIALCFSIISGCARIFFSPDEKYGNFKKSEYISSQIKTIYDKMVLTQKLQAKIENINTTDFKTIKIYDFDEENALSTAENNTSEKDKSSENKDSKDKKSADAGDSKDKKSADAGDSKDKKSADAGDSKDKKSDADEYTLDDYIETTGSDNQSIAKVLYNYLINNLTYLDDGTTMRETIKYNENSTNEVHEAFRDKKDFYKMSLTSFETYVKTYAKNLTPDKLIDVKDKNGRIIDNYFIYNEYKDNEYLFGDSNLNDDLSCLEYGRKDFAGNFSDKIYVYEKDDNVFFYDIDNKILYNTVSGYVKIDRTKSNGYVYFPADYVDATGEDSNKDGIGEDSAKLNISGDFLVSPMTATFPMCYLKSVSDDVYEEIQDLYSTNIGSHYWMNMNNLLTPGRELIQGYSPAGIMYYSDGKIYSNVEIQNQKGTQEETYKYYESKIMEDADVYVSKRGSEIVSKCKNSKGEFEDYSYFSDEDEESEIEKADFDFVIAYKTYDLSASDNYTLNFQNYLYDIAGKVNHPYVMGGIAAFMLILMIILLTVNADKRKYIDRIPVLVLMLVPACLMFGLILIVKEEASYFTSFKMAGNYDNLFGKLNASIVVAIVIFYFLIAELYLTCVRRIKNEDYKKNIFYRLFSRFMNMIRSARKNVGISLKNKGLRNVSLKLGATIIVTYLMALVLIFSFNTDASFIMFVIVTALAAYFFTTVMKLLSGMSKIEAKTEKISNQNFEEENAAAPLIQADGNEQPGQGGSEQKKLNQRNFKSKDLLNDSEIQKSLPIYLQKTYGNLIGISDSFNKAVMQATKEERTKAELITNVSHDIKTPLTSIINYVDLIKREDVDNPKIKEYADVLSVKSERLKVLISDLVEVSKADTGNIELEFANINVNELSSQVLGEFSEKFEEKNLKVVTEFPDHSPVIYADGRRMYRVLENIFQNVYKYAMDNTRVYFSVEAMAGGNADGGKAEGINTDGTVTINLKNISKDELNISPDELTERFVRGDRARSTEGSGLGLSIAKNLTKLMGGDFDIKINGDLFEVSIKFNMQK